MRSCTVVVTMFLCVKMVATKIAPNVELLQVPRPPGNLAASLAFANTRTYLAPEFFPVLASRLGRCAMPLMQNAPECRTRSRRGVAGRDGRMDGCRMGYCDTAA